MSLDASTLNSGFLPTERQIQNDKLRNQSPDVEPDSRYVHFRFMIFVNFDFLIIFFKFMNLCFDRGKHRFRNK